MVYIGHPKKALCLYGRSLAIYSLHGYTIPQPNILIEKKRGESLIGTIKKHLSRKKKGYFRMTNLHKQLINF